MMRKGMARALAAAICGLLGLAPTASGGDLIGGDCCPAPCGKKVCCPVEETKTVSKTCWTYHKKDFCLPCSMLGMLLHRCDCGKACHRRVLVMKIRKHDEPVKKCIPVEPDCHAPCAPGCGGGAPGAPATVLTAPWPPPGAMIQPGTHPAGPEALPPPKPK